MYLWVTLAGGTLWRWASVYEGEEKLMSFRSWSRARYPNVSLAIARERDGDVRRLLASGVDPMAQRKVEKTAERVASENLFASIATQWLEHWQHGKSPRHVDFNQTPAEANILPTLGARPIAQIEAPELAML